jgi:Icc-related predicted phosphoesterase
MNVTFISDTHNKHNLIPTDYLQGGDIIIHCGDVSSRGTENEINAFLNWYSKLPYTHKILIAGNHDFFFEAASNQIIDAKMAKYPEITYLNDSGIEIDGIKIWGSPVQPYFHNWAFNRIGDAINEHWNKIPLDTNIIITHGPIFGYLDMTLDGIRTGCEFLRAKLPEFTDLKIHACGHIHEGYGRHEFTDGQLFLNASVLNIRYEMQNRPIRLEYGDNSTLELGYILKK